MNEPETDETLDADLLAWSKEIDEIMTVAINNAIAENERLGIYSEADETVASPRVAEDD